MAYYDSLVITEYFSHIVALCMLKVLFCSTHYKQDFFLLAS